MTFGERAPIKLQIGATSSLMARARNQKRAHQATRGSANCGRQISNSSDVVPRTPLHDRVLVRRVEGDGKTKVGLNIPDAAKEKPQEGEVVRVDPGEKDGDGNRIALEVRAGDSLPFGKWSGGEITLDGEDLFAMMEGDIPSVRA